VQTDPKHVAVGEFNTRGFESGLNGCQICSMYVRGSLSVLDSLDSRNSDFCFLRKVLRSPAKKGTSSSDLSPGNHRRNPRQGLFNVRKDKIVDIIMYLVQYNDISSFRIGRSNIMPSLVQGRKNFIGGSDARVIMGTDEAALLRLWREKRGEAEPEDFSGNLLVQLGIVTEELNRLWYERNTGQAVTAVQRRVEHPVIRFLAATLDGMVEGTGAVFESKFMLPWSFSEEAAAQKYIAQLQHNMWVTNARTAVLSIITGGGKWVELTIPADSLYQHLLLTAEKKFWRCVESGEPPRLFLSEPPRVRIEAVRIIDMSSSNSWAEFAGIFCRTRSAFLQHENAKAELKALVPEDAKEAIGHGVRAKRSKSGAISFDLVGAEADRAALQ
jgi:hypothetical protein